MFIQWCCCQMRIVKYVFKSFSILIQSIIRTMRVRQRINTICGRLPSKSEITPMFRCKIKWIKCDRRGKIRTHVVKAPLRLLSRVTGHERCSPHLKCPELICFWHCGPLAFSCCAWLTWLFPSSFSNHKPAGKQLFYVTFFLLSGAL